MEKFPHSSSRKPRIHTGGRRALIPLFFFSVLFDDGQAYFSLFLSRFVVMKDMACGGVRMATSLGDSWNHKRKMALPRDGSTKRDHHVVEGAASTRGLVLSSQRVWSLPQEADFI
tara:strand:- start:94 stop:438 length:345 start_codon:yes stop_codon:yes gene_type:complete